MAAPRPFSLPSSTAAPPQAVFAPSQPGSSWEMSGMQPYGSSQYPSWSYPPQAYGAVPGWMPSSHMMPGPSFMPYYPAHGPQAPHMLIPPQYSGMTQPPVPGSHVPATMPRMSAPSTSAPAVPASGEAAMRAPPPAQYAQPPGAQPTGGWVYVPAMPPPHAPAAVPGPPPHLLPTPGEVQTTSTDPSSASGDQPFHAPPESSSQKAEPSGPTIRSTTPAPSQPERVKAGPQKLASSTQQQSEEREDNEREAQHRIPGPSNVGASEDSRDSLNGAQSIQKAPQPPARPSQPVRRPQSAPRPEPAARPQSAPRPEPAPRPPPPASRPLQPSAPRSPQPFHRPPHQPHNQPYSRTFPSPASAVPKARELQDSVLERLFATLRKEYPALKDTMLSLVASRLVVRELSPPHAPRKNVRDIQYAWVQHITYALEQGQEWALAAVQEDLAEAKLVFLSGERLVGYGGQNIQQTRHNSQLFLPRVSPDEAEAAIQALITHPELAKPAQKDAHESPSPVPAAPRGKRVQMPKEAAEMLKPGNLLKLHSQALQDFRGLLQKRKDVIMSADLDFGVVPTSAPSTVSYYNQPLTESLQDLAAAFTGAEHDGSNGNSQGGGAGVAPGSRMRARSVTVIAGPGARLTLIDVRGYPQLPATFALVDDARLCRNFGPEQGLGETAVRLLPGEEHTVTVILDTLDGPTRRAESGMMQQVLLFTFIADQQTEQPSHVLPDSKVTAVVVGCRVSAALTPLASDLQTLLNFDAKPFVAERLRTLFDRPPSRYVAHPPPVELMFRQRDMMHTVCPWLQESAEFLKPPPPAYTNVGASLRLRKITDSMRPYLGPAYHQAKPNFMETQARKYRRFLQLEEAAMEDQIRRHDLYSTRFKFAVFEAGRKPQYRIHTTLPAPDAELEAAAIVRLPRKTYRGPQLAQLFPTENMTGLLPRRVLLLLDVPGLPEDRPSLVFGDVVFVRLALAEQVEYAGYVIATESTTCMVAMPPEFYAEASKGRQPNVPEGEPAQALSHGLLHARFTFDRSRMQRMHAALSVAANQAAFQMLPPKPPDKAGVDTLEAGLPTQGEFLAAAAGQTGGSKAPQGAPPGSLVRKTAAAIEEVASRKLNAEQRWAVASFMEAGSACPYTLFGPPGTGKTVTLTECCLQVLKREADARLLVCAPQGYSADLLASALGSAGLTSETLLRLADPRHPPVQMKEDVLDKFSTYSEQLRAFTLPEPAEVAAKRVVVTTCIAAGILRSGAYKRYHEACKTGQTAGSQALCGLEFSHVLIDEAGQALLPEALVPITMLQPNHGKAMLCGDPKQLGPVVRSTHAASGADGRGLAVSLLECFIEYNAACAPSARQAGLAPATGTLVQNYRSHSSLLAVPNALFYNQALVPAADQSKLLPPRWSELSTAPARGPHQDQSLSAEALQDAHGEGEWPSSHSGGSFDSIEEAAEGGPAAHAEEEDDETAQLPSTIFFGVRGEQMREGEAPSYFNPMEATVLVDLLEGLLSQQVPGSSRGAVSQDDIGVIATYRKQVQKIRLLLRAKGLGAIRVGTVDDLQGQEERIIFISTVLSKPETLPPAVAGTSADLHLGFWRNPRRFNVAVTRAKALLVVLGHPVVLVEDPSWRELLRFCAARGAFRGAGSSTISRLFRSDALDAAVPGLGVDITAQGPDEELDLAAAVGQIAELALLGSGHVAQMFPETLEEAQAAYGEEVQWRVAL